MYQMINQLKKGMKCKKKIVYYIQNQKWIIMLLYVGIFTHNSCGTKEKPIKFKKSSLMIFFFLFGWLKWYRIAWETGKMPNLKYVKWRLKEMLWK